jgi:hypothetical protein
MGVLIDPVIRDLNNWLRQQDADQAREEFREALGEEIREDKGLFSRLAMEFAKSQERENEFMEFAVSRLERERSPIGGW